MLSAAYGRGRPRCRLALLVLLLALPAALVRAEETKHPQFRSLAREDFGSLASLLRNAQYDDARGAYFAKLADGCEAELTLDHRLQTALEKLLARDGVPTGAVVMTDPKTGRVLAIAGREETAPANDFALKAVAPAASVFKVVTAAALLEEGIEPDQAICFHGGGHSIEEDELDDDAHDNQCATLSKAIGSSINLVMSKLAARKADFLAVMAKRFFFNATLPAFPTPEAGEQVLRSPAEIPDPSDKLEFGRVAAGFGQVRMSAVHGALIAATVANNGMAIAPRFVEAVWTNGRRDDAVPTHQERVISEETAAKLVTMLERTVSEGTARKSFHKGRRLALGNIMVAGKTGTLDDHEPFRENTWFVGFAPATDPEVAISALAINGPRWKTRAPALARDALMTFFQVPHTRAPRRR